MGSLLTITDIWKQVYPALSYDQYIYGVSCVRKLPIVWSISTFSIHPFNVYFTMYDIVQDLYIHKTSMYLLCQVGCIYMEHLDKSFSQWAVKGLFTWLHLCYFIILFVHYLFTRFKGETDNHSPNGMSKYLVMNHDTKHTYSIYYPVEDFCLSIIKNTNKLEIFCMQRWMTENQKPSYRFQRVCLYFKNTKMC